MTPDPVRVPIHVTAHSSADALEAAKAQARSEGFVVRGVGRVELVNAAKDLWRVTLTLRVPEHRP